MHGVIPWESTPIVCVPLNRIAYRLPKRAEAEGQHQAWRFDDDTIDRMHVSYYWNLILICASDCTIH
jgi:hypothetical protein